MVTECAQAPVACKLMWFALTILSRTFLQRMQDMRSQMIESGHTFKVHSAIRENRSLCLLRHNGPNVSAACEFLGTWTSIPSITGSRQGILHWGRASEKVPHVLAAIIWRKPV